MIIFNTTYHVEDSECENFINFLKNVYIPQSIAGGFLFHPRLALIHTQQQENGCSYSLQFHVKNTDTLNHWLSTEGQLLHDELTSLFNNKALGFITLLEELDL